MQSHHNPNNYTALVKALTIGLIVIGIVVAGIIFMIDRYNPISAVTDAIVETAEVAVEVIDTGAENAADFVERGTETRTYEVKLPENIPMDLKLEHIECHTRGDSEIRVTLIERHGLAVFLEDSDTYSLDVPVTVRTCVPASASEYSADGRTIIVDATKLIFEADVDTITFMERFMALDNPADESGIERFFQSGILSGIIPQYLVRQPNTPEISGLMLALGDSLAAGSNCTTKMWDSVKTMMGIAYQQQAERMGISDVTVLIVGEPDLYQNDKDFERVINMMLTNGVDVDVTQMDIACDVKAYPTSK